MAKTSSLYIRIDPKIKTEVESIYARYGMSLTDAINIFIYQSRNVGGLPFDLRDEPPRSDVRAAARADKQAILDSLVGITSENPVSLDEARAAKGHCNLK